MGKLKVQIKGKRRKILRCEKFLRNQGFEYTSQSKYLYVLEKRIADRSEFSHWNRYAVRRGLYCEIIDTSYSRSSGYRKAFFRTRKPFVGNLYFCVYCGRLIPLEKVIVDHIVPVNKAERSRRVQRKLERKGFEGVNDPGNLGACCNKCNIAKGEQMGLWSYRGFIGQSNMFQVVRWLIRIGLAAAAVLICLYLFKHGLPEI